MLKNSKYLYPPYFLKMLGIKNTDSIFKKVIRGLYNRFINEPYFPDGRIEFYIKRAGSTANTPENTIRISYKPKRFVPGMIEDYFFDKIGCEITIK